METAIWIVVGLGVLYLIIRLSFAWLMRRGRYKYLKASPEVNLRLVRLRASSVGREKIAQGQPYRDVKADSNRKTDNQEAHRVVVAARSRRFNHLLVYR